ncbi:MAG TPA: hypothetical protein VNW90_19200 [Acetobacteraceae bacterium]|nr:hypothetical protein [Acetobacteraceae bacterium]
MNTPWWFGVGIWGTLICWHFYPPSPQDHVIGYVVVVAALVWIVGSNIYQKLNELITVLKERQ